MHDAPSGPPDLRGRTYFVAGGAGVAGEAVAAELLAAGAVVAVASRSPERLDRMRDARRPEDRSRLLTLVGDVGTPEPARELRDRVLAEAGDLNGVVAALGAWWEGPTLTALPYDTWQRILHDNLTSHFVTAQTFAPAIADRPGSAYIALAGVAALEPFAGSGPICVTGAAQTMLMRMLAKEHEGAPVRFHEVQILTSIVTRHWPDDQPVDPSWLTGEQVGAYIARVAAPDFPETDRLQLRIPAGLDVYGEPAVTP